MYKHDKNEFENIVYQNTVKSLAVFFKAKKLYFMRGHGEKAV